MEPSVTFRPIGRLGNILFECAATIGYARKYGYKWGVPDNTGECPNFHEYFKGLPRCNRRSQRYEEHPHGICPAHNRSYDLCHFDYHEIPNVGPDVTLFGFFQSWKYFEHCKEEVKEVFKLKHIPGYEDYVSIHVRRGDYVQHAGSFPPVTESYIDQSILAIKKKGIDVRNVIFFSDDIQWCKDNFPSLGKITSHFSEGRNELEDLELMASCGHHIIANSTFSYWGAYLGHNKSKTIISPSHKRGNWFGLESGVKQDCVDLIPDEWIQIEFR